MGFYWTGFFARAESSLVADARRKWPGCRSWALTSPFLGIAVASPDLAQCDSEEEWDQAREIEWAIETGLPEWSRRYPDVVFVFVEVDCHGGQCLNRGYVCQNGVIESEEPIARRGTGALRRLVAHLGVQINDSEDFAPFRRGFLDRRGELDP